MKNPSTNKSKDTWWTWWLITSSRCNNSFIFSKISISRERIFLMRTDVWLFQAKMSIIWWYPAQAVKFRCRDLYIGRVKQDLEAPVSFYRALWSQKLRLPINSETSIQAMQAALPTSKDLQEMWISMETYTRCWTSFHSGICSLQMCPCVRHLNTSVPEKATLLNKSRHCRTWAAFQDNHKLWISTRKLV